MYSQVLSVVVAGLLTGVSGLEVVSPSSGETIQGSSTYTVKWTGTGEDNRFEIDLYYCGSYCMEDDCGDWVTALCPYGELGCPDNEGDYDVDMPEPMSGTSGDAYKIRVLDVDNESQMDCSDEFYLVASDETTTSSEMSGTYLIVTAPEYGDLAVAGREYTVEFKYDDGTGSRLSRFSIDLYSSEGSDDCGTFVVSICDKPSIGCKDSQGDYDVVIPEDTPSGDYRIRIGNFYDDVYGCSEVFEIYNDSDGGIDDDGIGSLSFTY